MAIQKQFVLRYRAEGHVRFEIPALFSHVIVAKALTDKLLVIDGVYRVKIHRSQRKLSIRYQEAVCDFNRLANLLFQVIADLEQAAMLEGKEHGPGQAKQRIKNKLKQLKVSRWFGHKYDDARETIQAAKILTKVGLKQRKKFFKDPEKTIIDFFNDVLVLFLIRLHWDHITKEWIPKPLKYRYEWMAVFYMIFLLVRSRKPK